jgi:CheY-like chemotaxis protein
MPKMASELAGSHRRAGAEGLGMATVLIVEDQEQILRLVQSFLEEQGHRTLSAATADEALAILTGSEALDALFVDIVLNGDTQAGLQLAIRAVELKPGLKVVYSTGLSVTDDMKAFFVSGSAVLEKPYTVDQLLTSLSQ